MGDDDKMNDQPDKTSCFWESRKGCRNLRRMAPSEMEYRTTPGWFGECSRYGVRSVKIKVAKNVLWFFSNLILNELLLSMNYLLSWILYSMDNIFVYNTFRLTPKEKGSWFGNSWERKYIVKIVYLCICMIYFRNLAEEIVNEKCEIGFFTYFLISSNIII